MSDQPNDKPIPVASGSDGAPPWKLIALVVAIIGLLTFFVQNRSDAPVHFLWLDGDWPVWAVIAISVGIGIALDRLFIWQWRRARSRKDDNV
jgi:uncharacterized integral membrane protein